MCAGTAKRRELSQQRRNPRQSAPCSRLSCQSPEQQWLEQARGAGCTRPQHRARPPNARFMTTALLLAHVGGRERLVCAHNKRPRVSTRTPGECSPRCLAPQRGLAVATRTPLVCVRNKVKDDSAAPGARLRARVVAARATVGWAVFGRAGRQRRQLGLFCCTRAQEFVLLNFTFLSFVVGGGKGRKRDDLSKREQLPSSRGNLHVAQVSQGRDAWNAGRGRVGRVKPHTGHRDGRLHRPGGCRAHLPLSPHYHVRARRLPPARPRVRSEAER